jgi:arsenite/tail-anchored protein-transporting ATPase
MELARLVLVMGKGGVGKTTVARGLAATLAERGLRTALVELGSGAGALDRVDDSDASFTSLRIAEQSALMETATQVFGSARAAKLVFGNFAVKQLASVVPGVREYCLLVAARARLATYDRVIIDMPATGHGISWLSAAKQLAQLVPHGRARAQADALDAALRDERETAYVLVTLAEPMVLAESDQLVHALVTRLGVHVTHTVLNRVPAAAAVHVGELRALAAADPSLVGPLGELLRWAGARAPALASAQRLLARGHTTLLVDTGRQPTSGALMLAFANMAAGMP